MEQERQHQFFFVHPIFFAAFPALFLFVHNIGAYPIRAIVVPLVISLVITGVFLALAYAIFRNISLGAALTSLFLMFFFTYGHIYRALATVYIGSFKAGDHKPLIVLFALLFCIGAYLLWRSRAWGVVVNRAFFFMGGFLLVTTMMQLVFALAVSGSGADQATGNGYEKRAGGVIDREHSPDVYYFILDAYTNEANLREFYDFDNTAFLTALRERRFSIVPDGRSNYPATFSSIPSTMNMDYLDTLLAERGLEEDGAEGRKLMTKSSVIEFFKEQGYAIVNFSSGWQLSDVLPNADKNVSCGELNTFEAAFLQTTALNPFLRSYLNLDRRQRINCALTGPAELATQHKGPFFALIHTVLPHPPFIFGPNGELKTGAPFRFTNRSDNLVWEDKLGYTDQVMYTNREMLRLIDELLAHPGPEPIIVIQADHGTWSTDSVVDVSQETVAREKLGILNTLRFPNGGAITIPDDLTSVNTWRFVFNAYFGASFELLPSRHFIPDGSGSGTAFTEVTELVSSWREIASSTQDISDEN